MQTYSKYWEIKKALVQLLLQISMLCRSPISADYTFPTRPGFISISYCDIMCQAAGC